MSEPVGPFGAAMRSVRKAIQSTNGSSAELASADRLVAAADDADIMLFAMEVACATTLTAMDGFMSAVFTGLSDEEQMQMLRSEDIGVILETRDMISRLAAHE